MKTNEEIEVEEKAAEDRLWHEVWRVEIIIALIILAGIGGCVLEKAESRKQTVEMKTDQQIKAEEKDAEERIFTATEVVEFIILGLLLIAAAAQTIANLTGP